MKPEDLRALLEKVADQSTPVPDAIEALKNLPFDDLGFARVDTHRHVRVGAPEAIYGAGKTAAQVAEIGRSLLEAGANLLVTRSDRSQFEALAKVAEDAEHDEVARTITVVRHAPEMLGKVAVVAAGTSDLPVAQEARVTAGFLGAEVDLLVDVGVAGVHRLLASLDRLRAADVVIVVAGMDGALPSVVGGLVGGAVIAVPTSVGYGASFGGLSALLSNLNACAAGVVVVNIDNGFGAARAAHRILQGAKPNT